MEYLKKMSININSGINIHKEIFQTSYQMFYLIENSQIDKILNCKLKDDNLDHLYDIKLFDCLWEGSYSVMILFDNICKNIINKRKEHLQSYYKEIVNSITHNLKTPLHGILCAACI